MTVRNEFGARLFFCTCLWFCTPEGLRQAPLPQDQAPPGSRAPPMCLWFCSQGRGSEAGTAGTRQPLAGTRQPLAGTRHPPPEQTPQCSACWEIGTTSGLYASYWNAILYPTMTVCLHYINQITIVIHRIIIVHIMHVSLLQTGVNWTIIYDAAVIEPVSSFK